MKHVLIALPLLAAFPAAAQDLAPAEAALKAHVAFLASDAMKGREPGTPEFNLAAEYVAAQMLGAGLKPAGDNGKWFQGVPLLAWKAKGEATMTMTQGGVTTPLTFGKDFVSSGGYLPDSTVAGDLVFVGYGVTDAASKIDDYKGLDVKGKIVVALFGGPKGLPSEVAAHLGDSDTKAETAHAHGAAGIMMIESAMLKQVYPFEKVAQSWKQPRMAARDQDGGPHLPGNRLRGVGLLSQAGAAKLFAGSKLSWDAIAAADAAGKPVPRGPIGASISRHQLSEVWKVESENVVGRLEGSDPSLKEQVVVLSAHLDHVGIGNPDETGDTIYNGAMDNAVGTASMLEVARAFQASGKPPRRSILFVAVTAEEKGLIGSEYFALHPTVPVKSIVANVNLDMPIITYKFEDLVVYGADRTSIGPTVAAVGKEEGIVLTPDPAPEQASFVRSDHYSFVKAGIPAVSLEPGPKGPGGQAIGTFLAKHYHQPSDQIDQSPAIDWSSGVRFVRINYKIAQAIANADQRPLWNKGDYFGTLFDGPGAK
ncbi:M20/M25/M40 family metallo-hydrolase [Sphingomonas sp. JC676]|uniref:M28 family metallopeptidase n=1 Tax=Sphingomonas sp. JC676 TaxID=2768065 RepID=UPI001658361D|nr:M28 family metallopeptidase [Sphingomonas sp. JC676]MBC9034253.1 M20/M25/M40 family metallo-hydrolase [Sphingomonas sp. JC676]